MTTLPRDDSALIKASVACWKHKRAFGKFDASLSWAANELNDRCRDDPESAWPIILAIAGLDQAPEIQEALAAGPIEDLLASHGDLFIERVEVRARQDPAFKRLLGGVWQNAMTPTVWARFRQCQGPTW